MVGLRKNGTNKGGKRKETRDTRQAEDEREDGKELEIRERDRRRWKKRAGRCSHGRT